MCISLFIFQAILLQKKVFSQQKSKKKQKNSCNCSCIVLHDFSYFHFNKRDQDNIFFSPFFLILGCLNIYNVLKLENFFLLLFSMFFEKEEMWEQLKSTY